MAPDAPSPARTANRGDFVWALVWIALGAGILAESLRMDRLENQAVNPYTVPGIVPGLLGIALAVLGIALLGRSLLTPAATDAVERPRRQWSRFAIGAALFGVFALGLFGHVYFPLAAFLFVAGFVLVAEWKERTAAGTRLRGLTFAAICGLGTAALVTYVFQYLFLVQLP